jgi:L-ascorbate metabolism protein UlaG (beta-lactamase superfamily)
MKRWAAWAVSFCLALLAQSCAGSVIGPAYQANGRPFDFRHPYCERTSSASIAPDGVEVRQLGSGGVLIGWGEDAILIGPYFSRAGSVFAAATGCLWFNERRIRQGMTPLRSSRVRAILLGHSHFDHIGDVPVIARQWVPSGPIYTNDTGVNLLSPYPDVAARARSVDRVTDWIDVPSSRFRILPIPSVHAPQVCRGDHWPCNYAKCETPRPLTTEWDQHVPLRKFCGGHSSAYLIELLDAHGAPRFRVYYTDSALSEGIGAPPENTGRVDLAILCMASFDLVNGYPTWIAERMRPRHVILTHFEDFFADNPPGSWRFVQRLTNRKADEFLRELSAALGPITDPLPPSSPVCGPSTKTWSMPVPDPERPLYFDASNEEPK